MDVAIPLHRLPGRAAFTEGLTRKEYRRRASALIAWILNCCERPRSVAYTSLRHYRRGSERLAFIRTKKVGRHEYYQLVESTRINGNPRQKVLVHLNGHATLDDAMKKWPREIERLRHEAAKERERAEAGSGTGRQRHATGRADSMEKRANVLEANLEKLRKLKKRGVV